MGVLFKHRTIFSWRGKTPSYVLLGTKVQLPAVIIFPIKERVVFCAGPNTASFSAIYVVRKGNNTVWLKQENSDGSERTIPTSTRQIALFASPTTGFIHQMTARSTTDVATTTGMTEQISTCTSSLAETDLCL